VVSVCYTSLLPHSASFLKNHRGFALDRPAGSGTSFDLWLISVS